ncbi:MAG: hypothetical protein HC800_21855 [Phormidesmis sp. RL_2_1]|nr:hypothetical protein [Phormidesmis sp. RL_2_1]
MEIAALLTTLLSPFMPHLLKLGQPIAEEAGKQLGTKLGEGTWETAKTAWAKLLPKVNKKPLAQGAAVALSEDAEDAEAQAILTKQLEQLLTAEPDLAESLSGLLSRKSGAVATMTRVSQTVTGAKNIVIGTTNGSINITQG